jgi:hypothetical protein
MKVRISDDKKGRYRPRTLFWLTLLIEGLAISWVIHVGVPWSVWVAFFLFLWAEGVHETAGSGLKAAKKAATMAQRKRGE